MMALFGRDKRERVEYRSAPSKVHYWALDGTVRPPPTRATG